MIDFIDILGDRHGAVTEYSIRHGVNGEKSISGTVYTNDEVIHGVDRGWRLEIDNEFYVITFAVPVDSGNETQLEFDAVHEFFYEFSKKNVYSTLNGSNTAVRYLDFIFNGSGYQYNLEVTIPAFEKEEFGMTNRLALFNDFIKSTGVEFVVNNRVVRILREVGTDLSTIVKKGFNMQELRLEKNLKDFVTYKRGFGAWNNDEDQSQGRLEAVYRSPLADLYGELEDEPLVDERFSVKANLEERLQSDVENSYSISVQLTMEDLTKAGYEYEQPRTGDYIMAMNEDLGFEQKIRIVNYESHYDVNGQLIDHDITCNSLGITQKNASSAGLLNTINQALNNANLALERANYAVVSADGKTTNYFGEDDPLTLGYEVRFKDTWYQIIGEDKVMNVWNGAEWEPITDTRVSKRNAELIAEQQAALEEVKTTADYSYDQIQQTIANSGFTDLDTAFGNVKTLSEQAESNAQDALSSANIARGDAQDALSGANTARSNAQDALSNANNAVGLAQDASSLATTLSGQVSDFELTVNGFNQTVNNYEDQVAQFTSDVNGLNSTVASYETQVDEFGNTVSTYATQVSQFENTVDGLKSEVQSYEETLGGYSTQVSSFENTVNGLNSTVSDYQSDVQGYSAQVSTFENTVNGLNSTVSTFQSDVNGYSAQVSQFENTVSGLNSTVSSYQSDVQGYESQVSTLTNTVDGFNATVESVEGNYSSLSGTVQSLGASIGVVEGQITNKVWQTDIQGAIDGIEIGGRNLLPISEFRGLGGGYEREGYTFNVSQSSSTSSGSGIRLPNIKIKPYTEYTLSFKTKKLSGSVTTMAGHTGSISPRNFYMDGERVSGGYSTTYPDDEEEHYFVLDFISRESIIDYVYIQPNRIHYDLAYEMEIWDIKLEKGNKATDWTPAPEDTTELISSVQSEFTQRADSIEATISSIETDLDKKATIEKVNSIESTVDSTVQRIASVETDMDSKASTAQLNEVKSTVDGTVQTIATIQTDMDGKATVTAVNSIRDTVDGTVQSISDVEGNITTIESTVRGHTTSISDAEGRITTTEQTIAGLQSTVSDPVNGLETRVTTIANGFQVLSNDVDGLEAQLSVTNENVLARVQKGDVISQINLEAESTLIQTGKLLLDTGTVVFGGDAFIPGAYIENASIDSAKIGTLDGNIANIININASSISAYDLSSISSSTGTLNVTNWINIISENYGIRGNFDMSDEIGGAFNPRWFTGDWYLGTRYMVFRSDVWSLKGDGSKNSYIGHAESFFGGNYFKLRSYTDDSKSTLASRVDMTAAYLQLTTNWNQETGVMIYSSGDISTYRIDVADRAWISRVIGARIETLGNYNTFQINEYRNDMGSIVLSESGAWLNQDAKDGYAEVWAGKDSYNNQIFRAPVMRNTTTSAAPNMYVSPSGIVQSSSSSARFKLNIRTAEESLDVGNKILDLPVRKWNDKFETETIAEELNSGINNTEWPELRLKSYWGFIAEELEEKGLEQFVTRDLEGQLDGIQYAQMWIPLVPVIKDHKERIEKLEAEIKLLQGA